MTPIRSTALPAPVFRPERFDKSNPPPEELEDFVRPVEDRAKEIARERGYPVKNEWPVLIGPIHRDEFRDQARKELGEET